MFGTLMRDVKFAFRSLGKRPGFASIAILTIALGISINTAVFSAVYAILVNPLPYPHSDRLVRVWPSMPSRGVDRASTSLVDYTDLSRKNTSLEALGAYLESCRLLLHFRTIPYRCGFLFPLLPEIP